VRGVCMVEDVRIEFEGRSIAQIIEQIYVAIFRVWSTIQREFQTEAWNCCRSSDARVARRRMRGADLESWAAAAGVDNQPSVYCFRLEAWLVFSCIHPLSLGLFAFRFFIACSRLCISIITSQSSPATLSASCRAIRCSLAFFNARTTILAASMRRLAKRRALRYWKGT
jgi:hypothetical protein